MKCASAKTKTISGTCSKQHSLCTCSVCHLRLFLLGVCRDCTLGLSSHVYCTYCVYVAKTNSVLSKLLPSVWTVCLRYFVVTVVLNLCFHWFTVINIMISIFTMFPASGPLYSPDRYLTSLWLVQLSSETEGTSVSWKAAAGIFGTAVLGWTPAFSPQKLGLDWVLCRNSRNDPCFFLLCCLN